MITIAQYMKGDMDLETSGWTILPKIVSEPECMEMHARITEAFSNDSKGAIETSRGGLVGGRNLIDRWKGWRQVTRHADVARLINETLGKNAGLVRILYFDKPPGQSWSLSLHRDKTISVAEHRSPTTPFSNPTMKAGIPHVVATESLLQEMLTLRLHLDAMRDENGPLIVVPGTHNETLESAGRNSIPVFCGAGDVFVMRPLLLHGSLSAKADTEMHRRVVHLEFASERDLPNEYNWHRFVPV